MLSAPGQVAAEGIGPVGFLGRIANRPLFEEECMKAHMNHYVN